MKECPACGREVRPSVIKCVHCGESLVGGQPAAVAAAPPGVTAGATAPGGSHAAVSPPEPGSSQATAVSPPGPTAAQATKAPERRPPGDPWVTPSVRADAQVRAPVIMSSPSRALPTKVRARRVDEALMIAGLLEVVAAVVAYTSLALPWVQAQIVGLGEGAHRDVVADLVFKGSDSFAGKVGLGISIALAVLGFLWFWYGLDRGVHVPAFAHPGLGLLTSVVGFVVVAFAKVGYFFWDDAFVKYARNSGLTKQAMRDLLESRPKPTIQVQQLTGSYRFATAMALGLLASLIAWWSQRRRDLG